MNAYVLILGSKSDMARATAKVFAKNGFHLYLAGREKAVIEADASDLHIRYGVDAKAIEFDALDFEAHPALFANLDPAPEVVISFTGYMGDQVKAQTDRVDALKIMQTNYIGCASLLDLAANEMEAAKRGTIIGVSSVAGDRGRASNYFYGSSKAGFTAFLSGLRNRLAKSGVHVVTVKPGFVNTKMTAGLPLPGPITGEPAQVAKDIFKAFKKKKNVLYTLWMWRYIMLIIKNIPEFIFKKLSL